MIDFVQNVDKQKRENWKIVYQNIWMVILTALFFCYVISYYIVYKSNVSVECEWVIFNH